MSAKQEQLEKLSLVCMAEIVGAHGIKGMVKLKVFTNNPEGLSHHASFYGAERKGSFVLHNLAAHGNIWIAGVEGVKDRTAAEKLHGTKLYLDREILPEIKEDNTYYHADLIGLAARYPDGKEMGSIVAVVNFGASDLLEVKPPAGASFYIPFTKASVPDVNLKEKTVTIDPPPGLLD
jgi:16S rRNA processing protein RimM